MRELQWHIEEAQRKASNQYIDRRKVRIDNQLARGRRSKRNEDL